jgi:hypothetical protein
MDFEDFVRLHRLTRCTVSEIICENCLRVVVLSDGALPRMIECPGCGNVAPAVKNIVRAATSRELPWAGMVKVKAGSLVFLERKLPDVVPAVILAKPSRFERELLRLGLNGNPDKWRTSEELKIWVERNRGKTYIPEQLLRWWGLEVQESELNLAKSGEL